MTAAHVLHQSICPTTPGLSKSKHGQSEKRCNFPSHASLSPRDMVFTSSGEMGKTLALNRSQSPLVFISIQEYFNIIVKRHTYTQHTRYTHSHQEFKKFDAVSRLRQLWHIEMLLHCVLQAYFAPLETILDHHIPSRLLSSCVVVFPCLPTQRTAVD